MHYDERLITKDNLSILDYNIEEYFFDARKLDRLYQVKHDEQYNGTLINYKCKISLDIIENYLIFLIEKKDKTDKDDKLIEQASSYYKNKVIAKPSIVLDSKLFSELGFVGDTLFKNDARIIRSKVKNINDKAHNIYKSYIKGETLKETDINFMMSFLKGMIGKKNYENAIENVFNHMLNNRKSWTLEEKKFMLEVLNYKKCNKLGIPNANVYVTDIDVYSGKKFDSLGGSYSRTSIIGIQYDYLLNNKDDIYDVRNDNMYSVPYYIKWMQTINHELEHYRDDNELEKKDINVASFNLIKNNLFNKYNSNGNKKEYQVNYKYREIERKANIEGWRDTARIVNQYIGNKNLMNSCYFNASITEKEKAYSYQTDIKNKKRKFIEEYNIKNLIDIISMHPEELTNYSQLKIFFDNNGNIKHFSEFLKMYYDLNTKYRGSADREERKNIEDTMKCFDEFFTYYISRKEINSFNFESINPDYLLIFFRKVGENLQKEVNSIKDMCRSYSESNKDFIISFEHMKDVRLERIDKYISFINSKRELINKLKEYNDKNGRLQLFTYGVLDEESLINFRKNTDRYLKEFYDRFGSEDYGYRKY